MIVYRLFLPGPDQVMIHSASFPLFDAYHRLIQKSPGMINNASFPLPLYANTTKINIYS
jgi:hypothetical protein